MNSCPAENQIRKTETAALHGKDSVFWGGLRSAIKTRSLFTYNFML